MKVPCGRCIGCRLEHSRQWAMRCVHESIMHEQNSFITLTYNDEHLPDNLSINKRDLQLFIKRLRKSLNGKEVRYYGCGEYGDKLGRPHYHMCLFGHDFDDKEIHRYGTGTRTKAGTRRGEFDLYWSPTLEKVWGNGFCTIGELTFESAAYTARYITKKITGPPSKDHYKERLPEFAIMSRKPGLGTKFLEKYFNDVYPKDFVTINGKKYRPVRFYDNKLMHRELKTYDLIKKKREEKTENICENRLYQKELYRSKIIKPLVRRLENE